MLANAFFSFRRRCLGAEALERAALLHFFDEQRRDGSETELSLYEQQESREEEIYRCAACGHEITTAGERITVQEAHEHTFVNPGGYVYRIGCFRRAWGCLQAGESTDAFSWFKGCPWRYAVCGECFAHLGWSYEAAGGLFFGLILDRLSPPGDLASPGDLAR